MPPPSVPPTAPLTRSPLPLHRVRWGAFPGCSGTMGDSDCLPPVWHRSGCPRSTIPPQRPQPSLQQQEDAPTTGPDCGSAVARTVYFLGGDDRPSQVPGGPQCAHAPLSDPGGHTTPGLYSAALLPSGLQTPSAPTMSRISGLNHAAWTLAVYASPQQLPTAAQDSLPAGGQPLPGGLNGPLGPSRNFMAASMPPIPSDQASPGAPEGPPYRCCWDARQDCGITVQFSWCITMHR